MLRHVFVHECGRFPGGPQSDPAVITIAVLIPVCLADDAFSIGGFHFCRREPEVISKSQLTIEPVQMTDCIRHIYIFVLLCIDSISG